MLLVVSSRSHLGCYSLGERLANQLQANFEFQSATFIGRLPCPFWGLLQERVYWSQSAMGTNFLHGGIASPLHWRSSTLHSPTHRSPCCHFLSLWVSRCRSNDPGSSTTQPPRRFCRCRYFYRGWWWYCEKGSYSTSWSWISETPFFRWPKYHYGIWGRLVRFPKNICGPLMG